MQEVWKVTFLEELKVTLYFKNYQMWMPNELKFLFLQDHATT